MPWPRRVTLEGKGTKRNAFEAANWFKKSAEQHFSPAYGPLGEGYANGWGVKKDLVEAYKWLHLAKQQNLEAAQAVLDALQTGDRLSGDQIAEAKRRAEEFSKTNRFETPVLQQHKSSSTGIP